jgi:hypothetical protein
MFLLPIIQGTSHAEFHRIIDDALVNPVRFLV